MSAQPPNSNSRREMRKALIRLRLEMHRQEIRHEAQHLVNPLHRLRGVGQSVQDGLNFKHAPLWGVGAVMLMGFLTGRGSGKSRSAGTGGGLSRLLKLGTTLAPLIKLVLKSGNDKP